MLRRRLGALRTGGASGNNARVDERQRVLVVLGEGSVAATPDRCVLSLALNVMRPTVA
jgi:uncharacterized protein YggE